MKRPKENKKIISFVNDLTDLLTEWRKSTKLVPHHMENEIKIVQQSTTNMYWLSKEEHKRLCWITQLHHLIKNRTITQILKKQRSSKLFGNNYSSKHRNIFMT